MPCACREQRALPTSVSVAPVQDFEGQGARLKHEAAVIHFDQMELEGYGPFR